MSCPLDAYARPTSQGGLCVPSTAQPGRPEHDGGRHCRQRGGVHSRRAYTARRCLRHKQEGACPCPLIPLSLLWRRRQNMFTICRCNIYTAAPGVRVYTVRVSQGREGWLTPARKIRHLHTVQLVPTARVCPHMCSPRHRCFSTTPAVATAPATQLTVRCALINCRP